MGDALNLRVEELPAASSPGAKPGSNMDNCSELLSRIAAFLTAHPGRWCRVLERKSLSDLRAFTSRVHMWPKFPRFDGCEFRVRVVESKAVAFGRYTPPTQTEVA